MGSGTTAVASHREGRDFLGFEKNDDFFEMAMKRIKLEKRQLTFFEKDLDKGLHSVI
jgi:DNA modification methylase